MGSAAEPAERDRGRRKGGHALRPCRSASGRNGPPSAVTPGLAPPALAARPAPWRCRLRRPRAAGSLGFGAAGSAGLGGARCAVLGGALIRARGAPRTPSRVAAPRRSARSRVSGPARSVRPFAASRAGEHLRRHPPQVVQRRDERGIVGVDRAVGVEGGDEARADRHQRPRGPEVGAARVGQAVRAGVGEELHPQPADEADQGGEDDAVPAVVLHRRAQGHRGLAIARPDQRGAQIGAAGHLLRRHRVDAERHGHEPARAAGMDLRAQVTRAAAAGRWSCPRSRRTGS